MWERPSHIATPRVRDPGVHEFSARSYLKTTVPGSGVSDSILTSRSESISIRFPRGTAGMPFLPEPVLALDPTGYYWTGRSDSYALDRVSIEGDTITRLRVDQPRVPLRADERREAIRRIEEFTRDFGRVDVDWDLIPPDKPLVEQLFVDDRSRLWVKRATPRGSVFDVFESDGELVTTFRLGFEPYEFFTPVVRRNALYTVVLDELDVPYVVRVPLPDLPGAAI